MSTSGNSVDKSHGSACVKDAQKLRQAVSFAVLLVTALALAITCVGCSNGDGGSTEIGSGDVTELDAVYLPVKTTTYYSDGDKLSDYMVEYDEHGNVLGWKSVIYPYDSSDPDVSEKSFSSSDYDEFGYLQKWDGPSGEMTYSYKWEDGKVVEAKGSNDSVSKYTYGEKGYIETDETTWEGNTILVTYDEDGYIIGTKGPNLTTTYTWTKDDKGHPTSITAINSATSAAEKYTMECDENGNIVTVFNADGNLYKEYEYTLIENPSEHAWLEAHSISI